VVIPARLHPVGRLRVRQSNWALRVLSYDFSNYSKGIVDLFVAACDLVGVVTRVNPNKRRWDVRINRRASVALMEANVGIKR
jgi:hypothetical protein